MRWRLEIYMIRIFLLLFRLLPSGDFFIYLFFLQLSVNTPQRRKYLALLQIEKTADI